MLREPHPAQNNTMDLKWLAEQLGRPGFSQAGLARALGKDAAAVNRMLKGEREIKVKELPAIFGYLGAVPPGGDPSAVPKLAPLAGGQPLRRLAELDGRPDVPVWGSAEAGRDGAIKLHNDPIDYVRRSERMQGVRNPFAFYVVGGSMSPALEDGDQVVANPAVPLRAGADCVFLQEDRSGTMLAQVKRLVRHNADHWRVRQFSPARDFDLAKKKWPKAVVITEKRYG